jgi:hypothetical protein
MSYHWIRFTNDVDAGNFEFMTLGFRILGGDPVAVKPSSGRSSETVQAESARKNGSK